MKTTAKIPVQYRTVELERAADSETTRKVALSFSSEEPFKRWDGIEILDHAPGSVDLSRLNDKAALLVNHDPDQQIGVVESASIDQNRIGRAIVRFGKSAKAEEIFQDVLDGIRSKISVVYRSLEKVVEEIVKDVTTYRVTKWQPLEISIVGVPADNTVGIGRNADLDEENEITIISPDAPAPAEEGAQAAEPASPGEAAPEPANDEEAKVEDKPVEKSIVTITKETPMTDEAKKEETKLERARVSELLAIGDKCDCGKDARAAVTEGTAVGDFQCWVLENKFRAKPAPTGEIGMSDKEIKAWSMVDGIRMLMLDGKVSGIIKEASDAAAKMTGREARGFYAPFDVQRRDALVGTGSLGGYLATEQLRGPMIDALQNEMIVVKLGATVLVGLPAATAILIPRKTATSTAYYVAEAGAVTESQWTLAQVKLAPKTLGAFTDVSRQLILQSAFATEQMVRQDLMESIAHAVDLAAFYGNKAGTTTLATQPIGLLNDTTITRTAFGTTDLGAVPTYAQMVGMQTTVGSANGWGPTMAYATNHSMRGLFKVTPSSTAVLGAGFIATTEGGQDYIDGLKVQLTNSIPSDIPLPSTSLGAVGAGILFGDWRNLIVGFWSNIDIMIDQSTGSANALTRILAFQDFDVATRQPGAFVRVSDAKAATT